MDSTAKSYSGIMELEYRKYLSLVVLVFQNTALVLTMRYSRTVEGAIYLASTAVVLTELLKFIVCFFMVLYNNQLDLSSTLGLLKLELVDKYNETLKVSVPSILYTIQNNLLYVALTHLDAATFQVCIYSLYENIVPSSHKGIYSHGSHFY